MNLLSKIKLFLLFLIVGTHACNNSPIKIAKVEGHDFVSCNIDKIKDIRNLKLSEIAEYSQIVVLANDSSLDDEDYNIQRTVVSDKYVVVMPWSRAALLYDRNGKFIKRLVPSDNSKDEQLYGIYAQIDDEKDAIYILVCGLKILRFNALDPIITDIPRTVENSMDFVLFDSDKILGTFSNNQNIWAYIQSSHSLKTEYLYSRSTNIFFNHMSGIGSILKWHDKIILSFLLANDTSYYYNIRSKSFVPFLYCFSPKNSIKFNRQIENSPELLDSTADEILKDKKLQKKWLLFINERYCLFRLLGSTQKYFVIDKYNQEAYFLNKITNDFWGGLDMNYDNMFDGMYYVNNKDGYFTFHFSISKLKEEIKTLNIDSLSESARNKLVSLSNETEDIECPHNVLFISKLKKIK
ncbi:MAG: hypothetical protein AB2L24_32025 [Mangrovibacterium sp.]